MLGLSLWTEKGGSYRTIQRFYQSTLTWSAISNQVRGLWLTGLENASKKQILVG